MANTDILLKIPQIKSELYREKILAVDHFIKKLSNKKREETRIVDLGCGFGHLAIPLLRLGYQVTCVDRNKSLINMLKGYLKLIPEIKKNVQIENVSIEKFEAKNKFDVILCTEVLEHVDNPQIILKKINSLLKQNGILILSVPNGFGTYEIFFDWPLLILRKLLKTKTPKGYYHVNFFTIRKMKKLFKDYGFKMIALKKGNFFPILPMKSNRLERLDIKIAKIMPSAFVNDYMFIVKKIDDYDERS